MTKSNCPFYGARLFMAPPNRRDPPFLIWREDGGNRCAIVTLADAHCYLEVEERRVPDWGTCDRVRELRL